MKTICKGTVQVVCCTSTTSDTWLFCSCTGWLWRHVHGGCSACQTVGDLQQLDTETMRHIGRRRQLLYLASFTVCCIHVTETSVEKTILDF